MIAVKSLVGNPEEIYYISDSVITQIPTTFLVNKKSKYISDST